MKTIKEIIKFFKAVKRHAPNMPKKTQAIHVWAIIKADLK